MTAPRIDRIDRIDRIEATAYTIPTDTHESDGTIEWRATTIVLVRAYGGGHHGLGYSYADAAAADVAGRLLAPVVQGQSAMDTNACANAMARATRNVGRPGLVSHAISAVDTALWDLKARLLDLPLVSLLGAARTEIAAYGSGGFTSYSIARLEQQLREFADVGLKAVKMKVGREPARDLERVRAARAEIDETELFVDANGAYERKQALAFAEQFAELGVTWLEEPVSSDDLEGLRLLRDRAPAPIRIAAGEYGYDAFYFRRMLEAGGVDVLQADATRCGGVTGFLAVAALCQAFNVPLSAHTAPSLHTHLCCAAGPAMNVEYFHDHARIETMLFDGARPPLNGALIPDLSRPGLGLDFKHVDADRYAV